MMTHRPGHLMSDLDAVALALAEQMRRLADAPAGDFQLPLHPLAEIVVPVEPAELGAGRLDRELGAPGFLGRRRSAKRFWSVWNDRNAPAFAVFWIFQIIDMHFLPRWLKPTTAGWQPPARVTWRDIARVPLGGPGGRNGLVRIMHASIVANRGAILTRHLV